MRPCRATLANVARRAVDPAEVDAVQKRLAADERRDQRRRDFLRVEPAADSTPAESSQVTGHHDQRKLGTVG